MITLTSLRNFRPGKTWIVLGVALAIGGVAAFSARSYLNARLHAIENNGKGKTTMVVVAKMDVEKGARLSTSNVAVREIPSEYAHSSAVAPSQFDRVEGQALAFPVKSGEMILWGLLESHKPPTFSARVTPGRRAMTVPVDEINSISGMIEPGDTIDLIVTLDQQGAKHTYPLLQNALVMATGQRSVDDPKSGERRQYSTVTLDTTPQQAHDLIVAREGGKLTALLRNPGDKQVVAEARRIPAAPATHGTAPRQPYSVPVIYGGNLGKVAPEALRLGLAVATQDGATHAVANH